MKRHHWVAVAVMVFFGVPPLLFFLWDTNFYFVHVHVPQSVFWEVTLPFALIWYVVVGALFLTGRLGWKRRK